MIPGFRTLGRIMGKGKGNGQEWRSSTHGEEGPIRYKEDTGSK